MMSVHPATLAVVLLAGATSWSVEIDPAFAPSIEGGIVHTLATDGQGALFAGGDFQEVNDFPIARLVKLNANGTVDDRFTARIPDGAVYCIAPSGEGRLLIGGSFNTVNQLSAPNLALVASDGTLQASAVGEPPNGRVTCIGMLTADSAVFGGNFRRQGTEDAIYLGSTRGDDVLFRTALLPGMAMESGVSAVAVQKDGRVLVGGVFNTIAGPQTLIRLNADGSIDSSFSGDHGSILYLKAIIALENGDTMIAGVANAEGQGFVRRLRPDGSVDPDFQCPDFGDVVECLAVDSAGGLIAGGAFSTVNGAPAGHVVRLNQDGRLDAAWNVNADGPVKSVVVQADGKIVFGGAFRSVNDVPRRGLARLIPDATLSFHSLAGGSGGEFVTTLQAEAGRTYVIESTGDWAHWTVYSTNTATQSGLEVRDRHSGKTPHRFFRARLTE